MNNAVNDFSDYNTLQYNWLGPYVSAEGMDIKEYTTGILFWFFFYPKRRTGGQNKEEVRAQRGWKENVIKGWCGYSRLTLFRRHTCKEFFAFLSPFFVWGKRGKPVSHFQRVQFSTRTQFNT